MVWTGIRYNVVIMRLVCKITSYVLYSETKTAECERERVMGSSRYNLSIRYYILDDCESLIQKIKYVVNYF